jgi:hypothetical protein
MKWKRRLGVIALVAVAQVGIIYAYHVFQTTTLAWPSVHQMVRPKAKDVPAETEAMPPMVRQSGFAEPPAPGALLEPNATPPKDVPKKIEVGSEPSEPPLIPANNAAVEPPAPGDSTLRNLVAQQVEEQHKGTALELQKMAAVEPPPKAAEAPKPSSPAPLPSPPSAPTAPLPPPPPAPEPPKEIQHSKVAEPALNPLLEKKETGQPGPGCPPCSEKLAAPPAVEPMAPRVPAISVPDEPKPPQSPSLPQRLEQPEPAPKPVSVPPPDFEVIQAGAKISRPAPAPGAPPPPQPGGIPPIPTAPTQPAAPPATASATITSPWTLQVEVVDGKTILTAFTTKDAKFRVRCDKLDLQAPLGHVKAVGGVTIGSAGLEASCDNLTINLHEDQMLLEGKAQVKCLRDKRELEMKADRFSLRLSETTGSAAGGSKGSSGSTDKSAGKKQFKVYNLSAYQCRPGETAAAISRKLYGTEKYAQALVQFNRDYQGRHNLSPMPGATLYYPPKELLEESYPEALTRSSGRTVDSYYGGPPR